MLNNKWRLASLICMTVVIVGFGSIWGMSQLLNAVADTVNRHDQMRSEQAVRAAFIALQHKLRDLAADNALWDEAVEHSYGTPDVAWLKDTWGNSSAEQNYDTIFVVDSEGKTIAGFQYGYLLQQDAQSFYGADLARLLKALPAGSERGQTGQLLRTSKGLAVAGASHILPMDDEAARPSSEPRTLIFSKIITPAVLKEISESHSVAGVALQPLVGDTSGQTVLRSEDGTTLAALSWSANNPGQAAREASADAARLIVLSIMALFVPIMLTHYRTVKSLERSESAAKLAALTDPLSGLPNRTYLLDALNSELARPGDTDLALLFVDLDGFKAVNDAYDHATGDALIRAFGQGFSNLMTSRETAARLGGDEFAVLVSGGEAEQRAQHLARRIIAFAREPFNLNGRIASIGASVGIALREPDVKDAAEMMRRADIAMYTAKENGRNLWRGFDRTLDLQRSENLLIATQLRGYLERGEMNLAYQPIICTRSHAIAGVEALARWPGPENFGPDRFIPIAEEHGLIDALFVAVLGKAMAELAPYPALKLSVNVSALQINNPALPNDLLTQSRDAGFNHRKLQLEFTESQLIRNPKLAKQLISELQQLGMSVALDDFGTGFASLGYLREFAFNTIKLDKSLARAIVTDKVAQQVITGTVLIAKGLSAEIVAEGIESEEQANFMHLAGCNYLQGYYFSRPASRDALRGMLTAAAAPEHAALAS